MVKKAGAFFTYKEIKLGQGRENARDYLKQHPETAAQLEHEIRASNVPSCTVARHGSPSPEPEPD